MHKVPEEKSNRHRLWKRR